MAKTALEIDQTLVREAMTAMSTRTVTDTVHQALRRVVDLHRQMALLDRLGEAAEHDLDEARRDREQSSNQVQHGGFAGGSPTPG
jgi:Arc/MetJ family transcription regulator